MRQLTFLEDEQLAGVRPLLVARGLRLGLPAAVPHGLVVGVAVQAAMERCPAMGAIVAAPGRSGDAEVDFLPACVADVHPAHLAPSAPEALRFRKLPPCASPSSSGTIS